MDRSSRLLGTGVALALLAGCSQPAWRDPATSKGSAAVAPEVLQVVGSIAAAAKPRLPAKTTTTDPLPAPPDWAAGLLGKPLSAVFPGVGLCTGNADGVKMRYVGAAKGVRLAGWSWDMSRKAPVPRIVVANTDSIIVGAGDSGARRLDVPRVRPDIPSPYTGWEAITPLSAGPVSVFGVLADGRTVCRLGFLEL